ncbi:hypothetical protein TSUD_75270 [Trifolium subterraneum]|nr:hypothetical protein TSUD_75270 [Trifolium subterraneum]
MGRRILNDALRSMVNAEKRGKAMVELKPISTVISSFLQIMKHRVITKAEVSKHLKEDRLELKHPSNGEKNSGVIWDDRSTGKDLVTCDHGKLKIQKSFAYGISTHTFSLGLQSAMMMYNR